MDRHPAVPCLVVPKCGADSAHGILHKHDFIVWDSAAAPPGRTPSGSGERTGATICYTDTGFELTYTATDVKLVDNYTERQSTVWMGDAIEFYIAPSNGADPIYQDADEYRPVFELDLGAGGALFGIEINNTDGHGGPSTEVPHCDGCPSCHPVIPSDSGIKWGTSLFEDGTGWRGNLSVPFAALYESNSDLLRRNWRANFYRMDWGTIAAGTHGGGWQPDQNIDQECYVNPDCNASAWAPTYCDDRYPCAKKRLLGAILIQKTDRFTTACSGHTHEKLRKEMRFLLKVQPRALAAVFRSEKLHLFLSAFPMFVPSLSW